MRVEDDDASFEHAFEWRDSDDFSVDLGLLRTEIETLRKRWGKRVDLVGLAMPATVDPNGKVTTWPGRPSWTGVDLHGVLDHLFPAQRTAYADDGDLAALAEAREIGHDDIVYLGVGTGVGGGIVLHGRLHPGLGRASCEIGHIIIDQSGERCDCGRYGCLQSVASGPATLRRASAKSGRPIDFAELQAGLKSGDQWAVEAVEATCAALAAAVVSLGELLDPAVAVIGGGFAAGLPGFVSDVAEQVHALARPGHRPPMVRAASLGGRSSLYGALLLARSLAESRTS